LPTHCGKTTFSREYWSALPAFCQKSPCKSREGFFPALPKQITARRCPARPPTGEPSHTLASWTGHEHRAPRAATPVIAPEDGGASILILRVLYFDDLSVGLTESFSKTVSAADVVGFAEVTGDRNPIHLSEHFAGISSWSRQRVPAPACHAGTGDGGWRRLRSTAIKKQSYEPLAKLSGGCNCAAC
jgi:MaoC dehydratase-like protein